MNYINSFNEEYSVMFNLGDKTDDIGTLITTNYCLIKELIKLSKVNDIKLNNSGYIILKRRDDSITTLQRIIIEFYIENDSILKQTLIKKGVDLKEFTINGEAIAVDHINNIKIDNRTTNFQLLTYSNNINKQLNKPYDVIITNKELIEADKRIKESKENMSDYNYFIHNVRIVNKIAKNGTIEGINKSINGCLNICSSNIHSYSIISQTIFNTVHSCILDSIKYLTENNHSIVMDIIKHNSRIYFMEFVNSNFRKLNRGVLRYININKVIEGYGLLDKRKELDIGLLNSKDECIDSFFNSSYSKNEYIDYFFNSSYSREFMFDLLMYILENEYYTIENGNILCSVDLEGEIQNKKKYQGIRALFVLGLLEPEKRRNRKVEGKIQLSKKTFFSIPKYTEDLIKETNRRARKLVEVSNLGNKDKNKKHKMPLIRYFMVAETFRREFANEIYLNIWKEKEKYYLDTQLRAKQDIIDYLDSDELKKRGFASKEDIFEYIQKLNEDRKAKGEKFNKIYQRFIDFITAFINYNEDFNLEMKKRKIIYTVIDKGTRENIKKYQKLNNYDMESDLIKGKVLLLSSLKSDKKRKNRKK